LKKGLATTAEGEKEFILDIKYIARGLVKIVKMWYSI